MMEPIPDRDQTMTITKECVSLQTTSTLSSVALSSDATRRAAAAQVYTPLRAWETRLIRLPPGHPDDPLEVSLEVVILTLAPGVGVPNENRSLEYVALSYTWGQLAFDHRISCNGVSYTITGNLHEALSNLRDAHQEVWAWADALCINQYDVNEKSRQIENMFRIFQHAKKVIVWLGGERAGMDLAIQLARAMTLWQPPKFREVRQSRYAGSTERLNQDEVFELAQQRFEAILVRVLARYTCARTAQHAQDQAKEAALKILQHPWFSRVWVIQEFAAASSIAVHCGHFRISWAEIEVLPMIIEFMGAEREHRVSRSVRSPTAELSSYINVLNHARTDVWKNSNRTLHPGVGPGPTSHAWYRLGPAHLSPSPQPWYRLMRLLEQVCILNFGASEPVDRIYALLNAVGFPTNPTPQNEDFYISIDYTSTLQQVLVRLAKLRINERKPPSTGNPWLHICDDPNFQQGLPTWFPALKHDYLLGCWGSFGSSLDLSDSHSLALIAVPLGRLSSLETTSRGISAALTSVDGSPFQIHEAGTSEAGMVDWINIRTQDGKKFFQFYRAFELSEELPKRSSRSLRRWKRAPFWQPWLDLPPVIPPSSPQLTSSRSEMVLPGANMLPSRLGVAWERIWTDRPEVVQILLEPQSDAREGDLLVAVSKQAWIIREVSSDYKVVGSDQRLRFVDARSMATLESYHPLIGNHSSADSWRRERFPLV